ncbi:DNA helicase Pif1 like protein, partial [Amylocystis lapponica]
NAEQRDIFNIVVNAAHDGCPLSAFVDGQAGCGKTFLVNTICDYLCSAGHVVLPMVTSAYAAQLYPGGRTTHSAFKV